MDRKYRIVAHRGASAYEPENTLRAFQRAIELGADMSELDVQFSQDGALVVMHNSSLDETTNGHGAVLEHTLADLQALDAGKGERIPTLQQVIDLVRGRNGLYIELKAPETPRPTVTLLRANQFTSDAQVIVGSFQPDLVRETKEVAPEISVSLLVGPVYPVQTNSSRWHATRTPTMYISVGKAVRPQPHLLLTAELIQALRKANLGIVLWHEERQEEIEVLRTLDVDAILYKHAR